MINETNKLPDINRRVKQLIEEHTDGNISLFVKLINIDKPQKVNRLFLIDKRGEKYPKVSTDIILAIAKQLPVNLNWLLLGEGEKYKKPFFKNHVTD